MDKNKQREGLLGVILLNADIQESIAMMNFNRQVFRDDPTQENLDALYLSSMDYYKKVNLRCKEIGLNPLYRI